jgi:hypothetical protein
MRSSWEPEEKREQLGRSWRMCKCDNKIGIQGVSLG